MDRDFQKGPKTVEALGDICQRFSCAQIYFHSLSTNTHMSWNGYFHCDFFFFFLYLTMWEVWPNQTLELLRDEKHPLFFGWYNTCMASSWTVPFILVFIWTNGRLLVPCDLPYADLHQDSNLNVLFPFGPCFNFIDH